HDLDSLQCIGISKRTLLERLRGPNVLLNLAYSMHPPVLLKFERRVFCDLDPSEIFYWMTKMEVGQSYHHEFWTIGLNVHSEDCKLPKRPLVDASLSQAPRTTPLHNQVLASHREAATGKPLAWKTFYPLVDTQLFRPQSRARSPKITTVGQWYWGGAVEVDGEFPDLSKRFAFEPYLNLPARLPEARFELAMNIAAEDPERKRLRQLGWQVVDPHHVAGTLRSYRRYLTGALAEFTAV